jgi:hypothetical protein
MDNYKTPWLAAIVSLGLLASASRTPVSAQGLGWAIAPAAVIDTDVTEDTRISPALTGEIEVKAQALLSYTAAISVARTDFPVGPDDLHRNSGSVALGVRLMRDGARPSVGVLLGIGASFWDDVSETDPAFRSSAHAEEMLMPGVELRWPLGGGSGITFSVRDQMTGWWNALLDPSEGDVGHRLFLGVGLYHHQ